MSSLRSILFAIAGLVTFVTARPGDLLRAEEETPRTDCYGDPLPPGAVMRLGTTRFRDAQRCYTVAYSPDGKLLASGGYGGVVLWDAHTGKKRAFLESRLTSKAIAFGNKERSTVYSLAFSSDGHYLAAGCDEETIVWELAAGKASYLPGDEKKEPKTDLVGFTLDNRGLITGNVTEIRLRDWRRGQDLKAKWAAALPRLPAEKRDQFEHKVMSADGKIIVANVLDSNNKASLKVRHIDDEVEHQIEGAQRCLLALSPDHRILAVLELSGEKLTLRDVGTGKVLRSWRIERWVTHWKGALAFSPDGKRLATPNAVWTVATGKELCKLEGPCGPTSGLCFSPDGKTLAASKGGWIDFWKMPSGKRAYDFPNHRGDVVDLAYSPDGRQLATAGTDRTVRLWDTRTGRLIRAFGKDKYGISSLAFFPDGQRLATQDQDVIVIWNSVEGRKLREIRANPTFAIRAIAISPDGKSLFSAGSPYGSGKDAKYIREWDVVSGKERCHFGEVARGTDAIALSPDGKIVATASDDHIVRLWDRATGKVLHLLPSLHPPGNSLRYILSFSPDGSLLAAVCGHGSSIDLCDVAVGRFRGEIIPYPKGRELLQSARLGSIAFSPDGKTIISSAWNNETTRLIEVFSGQERKRLNIWSEVVFAPVGRFIASGSNGGALIWDTTGHRRAKELRQEFLSDKELESLWADLASTDATVAHRAIWTLIAGKKEAVSFLRRRIRTVPDLSPARMKELIDSLDSDSFRERERASRQLAEQAEAAKPALLTVLAKSQSPEQRRRATDLLAALPAPFLPASRLRFIRAIEIFEQVGDEESQKALKVLAAGAAGRVESEQAKTALQRLRGRDR